MAAHEAAGPLLLREMWDFPRRVPEDDRVDSLKAVMTCAAAGTGLSDEEKAWVIGYGAACGTHQDVVGILERNLPVTNTWGRVAGFDAIRACGADGEHHDDERAAVRREASRRGISEEVPLLAVPDSTGTASGQRRLRLCGRPLRPRRRLKCCFSPFWPSAPQSHG